MKKRVLAIMMTLIMGVSLAACGSSDSANTDQGSQGTQETQDTQEVQETQEEQADTASEEKDFSGLELEFWAPWDGTDATYAQSMIDQFCEEYGCTINFTTMAQGDYYTKMNSVALSGDGPDVAVVHVTAYINDYKEANLITSLSEACEKYGIDIDFSQYVNTVADMAKIDGEYYALPIDTIARVIVYNKTLLENSSVLDADGNLITGNTYDEFCKMAETIDEELGDSILSPVDFSPSNGQHVLNFLSFYEQKSDVPFFTDNEVTFDDEAAAEVLGDFAEFYQKYEAPGITGNEDLDLFYQGQIPVMITGTFNIGTILENCEANGIDLGMTYYPQWYDERAVTVNSHAMTLCNSAGRDDLKTELALTFIKWWGDNSYMWAESGALPANTTIYSSEEFLNLPGRKSLVESAQYAKGLPMLPVGMINSTTTIQDPIGGCMTGTLSAEDAIAQLRSACEEIFSANS